jgi:hypothetical protein
MMAFDSNLGVLVTIRQITQCGCPFKIVSFIFEKSQGKHNNWIVKKKKGNKFHYLQGFNAQNLMQMHDVSEVLNLRCQICFWE